MGDPVGLDDELSTLGGGRAEPMGAMFPEGPAFDDYSGGMLLMDDDAFGGVVQIREHCPKLVGADGGEQLLLVGLWSERGPWTCTIGGAKVAPTRVQAGVLSVQCPPLRAGTTVSITLECHSSRAVSGAVALEVRGTGVAAEAAPGAVRWQDFLSEMERLKLGPAAADAAPAPAEAPAVETGRTAEQEAAAVEIQRRYRGYIEHRRYVKRRDAAVLTQKMWRLKRQIQTADAASGMDEAEQRAALTIQRWMQRHLRSGKCAGAVRRSLSRTSSVSSLHSISSAVSDGAELTEEERDAAQTILRFMLKYRGRK